MPTSPIGGMSNVKIFVLYLMRNINYPLSFVTINDIVMQNDYVMYLDFAMAFHEMLGNATYSEKEVENYRKVTKEHFMQVYRNTVKREKASVLWYMRMDEDEG